MSIKSFTSKMLHRKTKTFWVGLFCLAVLVYLCLLARVNIQQFKSSYVQQIQQQLLQQARAEAKHVQDAVTILNLKLQHASLQIGDPESLEFTLDRDILKQHLSLNPKDFCLINKDGTFRCLLSSKDDTDVHSIQEISDELTHYSESSKSAYSVLIHDPSDTLFLVSQIPEWSDTHGRIGLSVSLSEFLCSIDNMPAFAGYGICLVGAQSSPICLNGNELGAFLQGQNISQEDHPYHRVLSRMRRGQEGVAKLSKSILSQADLKSSSEEILIGYSPLNLTGQRWSIAVISDDSIMTAAVEAHAQGILVAMVCLFAVLLIVCIVYYKSEKHTLLLQQQSELGQTTKELHQVTVEKRQIVEKLQNQIHFYRQLLDALPIPIYWRGRDGVLKNQNAAFRQMLDAKDDSDEGAGFIQQQAQIDHEVLTKDIELLNVPEAVDCDGHQQRYLVSRIPIRNQSDKNGMVSYYLPHSLFQNFFLERPCGLLENSCLTQELRLPIMFVDQDFAIQRANPAFYHLIKKDAEHEKTLDLAECLGIDPDHSLLNTVRDSWENQQECVSHFQLKLNNRDFQILVQPVYLANSHGAILLLKDQSHDAESAEKIEFELYRCRSELNEQEIKIQKYEECIPERLERLFRDKVKRAEEILAMKDEDPMSTFPTQQLIESVQKSLSCYHEQTKSANVEFQMSDQIPSQISSQWHKLYQSLVILGETLTTQASGAVRICVQNKSEVDWLGNETDVSDDIIFSFEYEGVQPLEGLLSDVLDADTPLTQWYHQCQQRDLAINLRVAARLLSKIDYHLKASFKDGISRFWFVLPVNKTDSESETDLDEQRPGRTESSQVDIPQSDVPHILIVDDVDENCTLMQILLAKDGHRSTVCQRGEQAVQICSQERFDLILMDIQMPGMSGLEATRQIRSAGMNVSTPIIAMTASNEQDDELTALDCGCDDYLTKPIKRKLMERKIWRSLEKTRQIKDAEAGKDIISFLDGNGDYQKAIEAFIENLPQRVDEMKLAFDQHDMKDLAFKVHALKGLGGFAGFAIYTEKACQLEESIKEKNVDKMNTQIDEMIQMCMRTRLKTDC